MTAQSDDNNIVHVIDDEIDIRESLLLLLGNNGFKVSTYVSAEDFLANIAQVTSGCILSDIRMDEIDGMMLQKILLSKNIVLPMIFITGHGDVPMCAKAMKNGAIDFLLKPFSKDTLLQTVRHALVIGEAKQRQTREHTQIEQRYETLTAREKGVFLLLVESEGHHSSKSVAQSLSLSVRTVEKHRLSIFKKMQTKNIAQLVSLSKHLSL
ncbi:response regulator transcription factor [Sessilibacter corallicola]|uniref:Response regulator FixJ n=1 Tax=Sessilibacter corallicola TaxID=2904075 RepID=A0ABQ0AF84_9GAMM